MHYVQKMIATGQRIVAFGKPRLRGQRMCMEHPEFEVIEGEEEVSVHFGRITPIYPRRKDCRSASFASLCTARWRISTRAKSTRCCREM
jgi:RecG-like helicase